ncbi:MAG: PfkB family carbohydrate kinase [Victivallaceae bacterium]|nr:PfkB family carbohydrate kinase [Victivallaceae bacterium]
MKKILILGPNPVWQKTMIFDRFAPYRVNRAQKVFAFASGKGINFNRALLSYGAQARGTILQFLGGDTGRLVAAELDAAGVTHWDVPVQFDTRTSNTVLSLADQSMTELIEPNGSASDEEQSFYWDLLQQKIGDFDGAAVCGTLPGKTPETFYEKAIEIIREAKKTLLLDTAVAPLRLFASTKRAVLKINREELMQFAPSESIIKSMKTLRSRFDLAVVAITDGPGMASLLADDGFHEFHLPVLPKVVSPLGSGDSASAVLLAELVAGTAPAAAFRKALAAASANCLTDRCAVFSRRDADAIEAQIEMVTIKESKGV